MRVLLPALLLTLLSVPLIQRLEWRLDLVDLLPDTQPSSIAARQVARDFGGFGTLTAIVASPDSAINGRIIRQLDQALAGDSLVNFTEWKTPAQFFRRHALLYISLHDLETLRDRLLNALRRQREMYNPLWVDLLDNPQDAQQDSSLTLEDIESKYSAGLADFLGTPDGTIRILEIYPSHPVTDLDACRSLLRNAKGKLQAISGSQQVRILWAGKVEANARSGGALLAGIRSAGIVSGIILLVALLLLFHRQPQIPLLAAAPISGAILITMGTAAVLHGFLDLFTFVLAPVLAGFGAAWTVHLFLRYLEERRNGLSPGIAMESALLETGPALTVSALSSAGVFFVLSSVPLAGVSRFGLLAGIGLLLQWAAVMLVFPALLMALQKRTFFRVLGTSSRPLTPPEPKPFRHWKKLAWGVLLISALLCSHGFLPEFEYRMSRIGTPSNTPEAMAFLAAAGHPNEEPVAIIAPDAETAESIGSAIRRQSRSTPGTTISRVVTLGSLLPGDQDAKLAILDEIQSELSDGVLDSLHGIDSINASRLLQHSHVRGLSVDDLPDEFLRKFTGRDGSLGRFLFVFPSIDADDVRACRRFAKEIRSIRTEDGREWFSTGEPIIRADLFDLTLPYLPRIAPYAVAVVLLLILLHLNRLHRAAVVVAAPLVGFLWLLASLRFLNIPLDPFGAVMLPILAGISIDGSLVLFQRWREEGTGSLQAVLRKTGPAVIAASLTSMVGFSGLLASSHPGLRSMGIVAIMGIGSILLAHLVVFPAIVGWIDWRRWRRRQTNS